eukprot:CAMPEP_0181383936 /NCGR_PEP_ID=MMETSP1106-20121128/21659_1 /TAXON_ID=81844 /ORGANISM="Mantoniella antarctica, Strain SL-175" /LENGTH=50 /DNA_ID=CAMNT_0023503697 /DNA_START=72 /DNA_END=224 /DNA_ORIENTATION=+
MTVGLILIPVIMSAIPMPTAYHLQLGHDVPEDKGVGNGQNKVVCPVVEEV